MPENYGIKVSPAGTSVDLVIDKNSRLNSKFSTFKAYKFDTISFSLDGSGNYTYTIPHDLGYAPAFDVFIKGTASFSFLTATTYSNAWWNIGGSNRWFSQDDAGGLFAYSDSSNLYIQAIGVFKGGTITAKYYIYVDQIEEYQSPSNIAHTSDYGIKTSLTGFDVSTAQEYKMGFSSKYKSLQYFSESIKSGDITLPAMWASFVDTDTEEATYIDFEHGLGYAPYFQAFFAPSAGVLREVPYSENDVFYSGSYTSDPVYEVSAWCDETRIRVTFWRRSAWLSPDSEANRYFSAQTINVTVIPFAERL